MRIMRLRYSKKYLAMGIQWQDQEVEVQKIATGKPKNCLVQCIDGDYRKLIVPYGNLKRRANV